ncbi:hypothetical protein FB45DRAFT_919877 [Roridomyces roridus]|uniref:DUF6534 domain-containing protein n=1 Tax=Roridomyces roridus TaxID=1738132 RepID=A0AAD7BSD9_9AGAR|nr:hypothetical protein FB45DRAFT_919877 [Roridomyces roridus]
MLVGVFMNMILYGVLVSQALTYYQVYKRDALWMRIFVACLLVIETANTALDMAMMYQPLILEYGQKLVYFPTVFMTQPLCVVLVSMPIQIFFAWRIFQLTQSLWIPLIISVFSVASFAGGVWTATMVQILREFVKKPLLHNSALLWFLASCVADVLITISLVRTLMSKKTGFVATDSVLDKIIRTTIQTGMITAIFSILDIVCFMAFPASPPAIVSDASDRRVRLPRSITPSTLFGTSLCPSSTPTASCRHSTHGSASPRRRMRRRSTNSSRGV